jgi:hypothetical protein
MNVIPTRSMWIRRREPHQVRHSLHSECVTRFVDNFQLANRCSHICFLEPENVSQPGMNQTTESGGRVSAAEASCPSQEWDSVWICPMFPMPEPPYAAASVLSTS